MSQDTYISLVHRVGCVICAVLGMAQVGPTQAHHIRTGQGGAQRAQDELACALCHEHHLGGTGIHGGRSAWRVAKLTELAAVALTIRAVFGLLEVNERPAKKYSRPVQARGAKPGESRSSKLVSKEPPPWRR